MKPTSIVFLIVAIVLIIGGFATAGVAKQMAAREGIELSYNPGKDAEDLVFTYEYGEDSIGKITVDLDSADVNVIGGAAKPYVELINFADGMYEFSSTNRVMTIKDGTDFTSWSGLATLAMNFKGLRSFVNYGSMKDLERTVNIYVCEENPVKIVDVSLDAGVVSIKDSASSTDYNVSLDAGEVTFENVSTASAVTVELDAGNVNVTGCDFERFTVELDSGNVNAKASVNRLSAEIGTGAFNYNYYGSIALTNVKLFANVGTVTVDGIGYGGYKETNDVATDSLVDISVSVGDIIINSNTPR